MSLRTLCEQSLVAREPSALRVLSQQGCAAWGSRQRKLSGAHPPWHWLRSSEGGAERRETMATASLMEMSPSYTLPGDAEDPKMSLFSYLGTLDPCTSLGSGDSASFRKLLPSPKAAAPGAGGMLSNGHALQGAGGEGPH